MKKGMKYIITAIFTFIFTIMSVFVLPSPIYANAETIVYSNVLADLKKSSNFNEDEYQANIPDYTLSVITIAEGENSELFIYVYQPSYGIKMLTASSINISVEVDNNLSFQNYDLIFLGQESVFQKYVVSNFVVNEMYTRYYEISSLFRLWDSTIDLEIDKTTENTINEVAFGVGKRFKFEGYGENLSMLVNDIDLIEVTDKYVGFLRYPKSFFNYGASDFHFIAFSTDKHIEKLLEVDILYSSYGFIDSRSGASAAAYENYYYECACGESEKWSDGHCKNFPCNAKIKTEIINLQFGQTLEFNGGWFVKDKTYQVIEKASDFLASADTENVYSVPGLTLEVNTKVDDTARDIISKQQWCIRFLRTDYETKDGGGGIFSAGHYHQSYATRVEKVSIMRLAFETDGVSYNLGVIDNKQTGSLDPSNSTEIKIELDDWFEKIVMLIAIVLLAVVVMPFLSPVISLVFNLTLKGVLFAVKSLIKTLLWLFSLPLRLFRWIFKRK